MKRKQKDPPERNAVWASANPAMRMREFFFFLGCAVTAFCKLSTADASPLSTSGTRNGNGRRLRRTLRICRRINTQQELGEAHVWASIVFVSRWCFKIRANISSHLGVGRVCFLFILFFFIRPCQQARGSKRWKEQWGRWNPTQSYYSGLGGSFFSVATLLAGAIVNCGGEGRDGERLWGAMMEKKKQTNSWHGCFWGRSLCNARRRIVS